MAMKKSTRYIIAAAVVACVVIAVFVVGKKPANGPSPAPTDALAQCLTAKGVKMYGAYWCSHCQNQKKEFGSSWQYASYVECALPGNQGQTKECEDAGIKGYPTWVFPGGKQLPGEQSFETLAQESGCPYQSTP